MTDPVALWHRTRDALGMTERDAQEELFTGVVDALRDDETAFGSAPCGGGKSMLVVPVSTFTGHGGRVVHSSYTKAQQSQMTRDGVRLVDQGVFTAVAEVRGRSEYLCNRRRAQNKLQPIYVAGSGLRRDLSPMSDAEWEQSHSDAEDGCGPECEVDDFALLARERAKQPGALVVVNHALLILDYITNGALVGTGPEDVLVLDEAHQAPDAFRGALGASISIRRLTRLARLAEREMVGGGSLAGAALTALEGYLRSINLDAARKATGDPFIYLTDLPATLEPMRVWANFLANCGVKSVARIGRRLADDLRMIEHGLVDGSAVAWVEAGNSGTKRIEFRPLDVRDTSRQLFASFGAAVATSATVEGYAMEELGGGRLVSVGSPFDERTNRLAIISRNGRDGRIDDQRRLDEMVTCVRRAKGGVLVLAATNKVQVNGRWRSMMDVCEDRLTREGYKVGVQRATSDVPALVEGLKDGSLDVVVGTMSMREGIDIKGPALSMIVLMALQWSYMGDPLLKARMERAGGNKWSVVSPLMESNTSQAIGRLLRDVDDRGHVVLLDGRAHAVKTFKRLVYPSPVKEIA